MSSNIKLPVEYNSLHFTERRAIREEYIRVQNGLCYYCNAPLSGEPSDGVAKKAVKKKLYPEGFFNSPIHLHHSHVTGMTLGAVHCHCNAVLWEYEGE